MEEDNLKKIIENNLKKKLKNEDNLKKNQICSWFLLNLGQTFPGIGSAL